MFPNLPENLVLSSFHIQLENDIIFFSQITLHPFCQVHGRNFFSAKGFGGPCLQSEHIEAIADKRSSCHDRAPPEQNVQSRKKLQPMPSLQWSPWSPGSRPRALKGPALSKPTPKKKTKGKVEKRKKKDKGK